MNSSVVSFLLNDTGPYLTISLKGNGSAVLKAFVRVAILNNFVAR